MPANLSLILNLILLLAVVIAISRLMKARRQDILPQDHRTPSLGSVDNKPLDEIIAVRKLTAEFDDEHDESLIEESLDRRSPPPEESRVYLRPSKERPSVYRTEADAQQLELEKRARENEQKPADQMVMMFLLAKESHQFAGYELLQTVLAAGLRFGEGNLFHRHQLPNGQGPVIFSLAAATASGVFDLQNMGAFNVRGLCLFMQLSGSPTIDIDRFNILYETARQLSEGLDAHLLDDRRQPLTKEGVARYQRILSGGIQSEMPTELSAV